MVLCLCQRLDAFDGLDHVGSVFVQPTSDNAFLFVRHGVDSAAQSGPCRADLGPARSGLSRAIDAMPDKEERIVARRLDEHRANMVKTIEGIKALAEEQARS